MHSNQKTVLFCNFRLQNTWTKLFYHKSHHKWFGQLLKVLDVGLEGRGGRGTESYRFLEELIPSQMTDCCKPFADFCAVFLIAFLATLSHCWRFLIDFPYFFNQWRFVGRSIKDYTRMLMDVFQDFFSFNVRDLSWVVAPSFLKCC